MKDSVRLGYELGTGKPVDADGHWLAGLVDGEGCFSLYVRKRKRGPSYIRIDFGFKIALRADDWSTLVKARSVLGVRGSMYRSDKHRGPNGKPIAALQISKKSDITQVIRFFSRYPLRSKKRRDFDIWSKAFEGFSAAIDSTPLECVSLGREFHRSRTGVRRPRIGTPRRRFRAVPKRVLIALRRASELLRRVRRYR